MKKIGLAILALVVIGVGFYFSSPKEEPKAEAPKKSEQVVTFANFRDIRDLNPHLYSGELYAQNMLFESLVHIASDGKIEPWLATEWKISDEGKTYVFKLREDVSFSDGEKFNAKAAKANFDAILSNIKRHGWLESVRLMDAINQKGGEAVQASGEYELTLKLDAPYYPLLVELGVIRPFRFISPKAFINGTTKDGVSALSGTGRYVLKENHKDEYAVFELNPNYWGKKPELQKVIVKVIPDNQTRLMALEKGEIDLVFGVNMVDSAAYNKFANLKGFSSAISEPLSTRMILLNTTDAITGDVNVRKAIQHATDKETISKAIFAGIESPADLLLSKNTPYANIGLTPYAFDKAKAEALLEASGWMKVEGKKYRQKEGRELAITLNYNSNNVTDKTIAEFLQGEFTKIGMNLNIVGEEEQANRDRMKAGSFQMVFNISWGMPYDPQSFLAGMRKVVYGDYLAQQGLKDKALIDETILHALESTDEIKRQEHYRFVLTRLHDEAVYLPLTYERNRAIFNQKLENVGFDVSKYEVPFERMRVK
ncbi:nickel ABC transporter substrate-binding protein [Sulfurospirillum deleyianum]|uniref:Nickel ABC transporter, periplasmic nickel-binding protein n=1 Tax=Sulfurospirillum deleyianum (strain ATCC 51133 / DSM 6946 / 5175) TaxID=525898 RepID=D1B0R4_SULD5|nr:nickel ABC transporter substrate-binding protein [Sulfurospirillum deleyianum]ACZ11058.1 nickel ABC transporter, periplasmic nickel- binding protein [Sulfurospirillum deleyianum DSM 6946]